MISLLIIDNKLTTWNIILGCPQLQSLGIEEGNESEIKPESGKNQKKTFMNAEIIRNSCFAA